jgi:glyoxylase-like metal-dependent hydrolase (beta-lactamase superfamily II)
MYTENPVEHPVTHSAGTRKTAGKSQARARAAGVAAWLFVFVAVIAGCASAPEQPSRTYHSELEYLKAVNERAPARDPQMIFLLMAQYLNANQSGEGIRFFSGLIEANSSQLSGPARGLYLSERGLLKAAHAGQVPLFQRIGWVKDTIADLEQAKRLTGGAYITRWIAGVVYAKLPGSFGMEQTALADLAWCLANDTQAPDGGWLREVYFGLALVHSQLGHGDESRQFLARSGYGTFDKPVTLVTPFSISATKGGAFARRTIGEPVPGRVFQLSGFEFTQYYFVVSGDRTQLIAIDMGARPDSAQAAMTALRAKYPGLPTLTTILVTHAHWDHIGGYRYFRAQFPQPKIYARANYQEELARVLAAPAGRFSYFFGSDFRLADVADFKPDLAVAAEMNLDVGGTRIALIPVQGGETGDALFIHVPELGVLFVGDMIMPFVGAPFVEEGSVDGLLGAIDIAVTLNPKVLLHGHEPLTRIYPSPAVLAGFKRHLAWLKGEVEQRIRSGASRAAIHQANLIPPFIADYPAAQLPYLLMRENVINRLYDQQVGYWQPDLSGMDHLGREETGKALAAYLGLSDRQIAAAGEQMIAAGDHELAAKLAMWGLAAYPDSAALQRLKQSAFLKLSEKFQGFNPFKYIVYSEQIGRETPQLEDPGVR